MHVDHVRPVRPAHLVEDDVAQNTGIVDQDVDAAEGVDRGLDDLLGVLRLGDGERGGDGLAAGLFDGVDRFLRRAGIEAGALQTGADVAHHHARAFLGHQFGDGAADAASRSGDDGDFSVNNPGHFPAQSHVRFRPLGPARSGSKFLTTFSGPLASAGGRRKKASTTSVRRAVTVANNLRAARSCKKIAARIFASPIYRGRRVKSHKYISSVNTRRFSLFACICRNDNAAVTVMTWQLSYLQATILTVFCLHDFTSPYRRACLIANNNIMGCWEAS